MLKNQHQKHLQANENFGKTSACVLQNPASADTQ